LFIGQLFAKILLCVKNDEMRFRSLFLLLDFLCLFSLKLGVLKAHYNAQHQGHARQSKASAMKSLSHKHDDDHTDDGDDSDDSDWLPDQ
jgi:hypothetical protein